MMSLPLARVFQCLFKFALIGGNLTTQSTGSHRGFGGGVSNSRDVVAFWGSGRAQMFGANCLFKSKDTSQYKFSGVKAY